MKRVTHGELFYWPNFPNHNDKGQHAGAVAASANANNLALEAL
jgi:hypothetical protein